MLSKEELRMLFPVTQSDSGLESLQDDGNTDGEALDGQSLDGAGGEQENQDGGDAEGENAGDENTGDEAADGENADGENTGNEAADGENADGDTDEETITAGTEEAGGFLSSHPALIGAGAAVLIALLLAVFIICLKKDRREKEKISGKAGRRSKNKAGHASQASRGSDAYDADNIDDLPRTFDGPRTEQDVTIRLTEEGEDAQEAMPGDLRVGKMHNVGKRSNQQDSFGISRDGQIVSTDAPGVAAIVADGMGGLADGDQVSVRVTISMLQAFDTQPERLRGDQKLLAMLNYANKDVNQMLGEARQKKSGSTVVAVLIEENSMYWLSVGDSHIYLYRDGVLMQLNRDHVYAVELDEKAARGEISVRAAMEDPQRKALTSYIGMGTIEKIDRNTRPLRLQTGDRILLMSDGVFGTLTDEEITAAMKLPLEESTQAMEQMIQTKNRPRQDNYTALVLEYC